MFKLHNSPVKLFILPYIIGEESTTWRSEETGPRPHGHIGSCGADTQTPAQWFSTLITQRCHLEDGQKMSADTQAPYSLSWCGWCIRGPDIGAF